jgi:hypothetical protein
VSAPYPLAGECPGCGQQSAYSERCPRCVAEERKPQGTQPALFTPTPAPVRGQLDMKEDGWQRPLMT